jgi:glycosyltransferase involved in cell wall biosynthesis
MLLIDAMYINNSGGKVLLDYLMKTLSEADVPVTYILDNRIRQNHVPVNAKSTLLFFEAGIYKRHRFYMKNINTYSKILCFASLPPSVKVNSKVFTYFHQLLYIENTGRYSFTDRTILKIKSGIARFFKSNTDLWLVQSSYVKQKLASNFKIDIDKIRVLPFYPPLVATNLDTKITNSFLYVSEAHLHKNHVRLLEAFEILYNRTKTGVLHLTVSSKNSSICLKIKELESKGIPVINHGSLERERLKEIYSTSEFLIYPSSAESFGLGIIEGLENNCIVIGADLPYMHSACIPSITFDPNSVSDIVNAMEVALSRNFLPSKQLIHNEIDKLIELITLS